MSSTAATPEMKCKSCGAPIPYVAGENVLHCSYCGSTTMVASLDNIVKVEEHFIIPNTQSNASIQQHCRKWMSEGVFKAADLDETAAFGTVAPLYLPFWVVHADVNTYYSGMNRRTRTVGYGNQRSTETYYEPTSGSIQERVGWVVYARSNMSEYWGLQALNPGGEAATADWGGFPLGMGLGSKKSDGVDLTTGKVPFSAELAKGVKILNGQITQQQAEERAKAQLVGYQRKEAEKRADQITDCDTTVQIERTELIYAPLWFIDYNYKGKAYHMLAHGQSGAVITGQAPVGKWDKVAVVGTLGGVLAFAFGLGAHFAHIPALYLGTAAAITAVGIYAFITALKS